MPLTCEAVGQPQGALSEPFDKVGGHSVSQACLDEAPCKEKGNDDEPNDLIGHGTARHTGGGREGHLIRFFMTLPGIQGKGGRGDGREGGHLV